MDTRHLAHKLNELHEDLERVLALTEGIEVKDVRPLLDARRLVRKGSETAASVAHELGERRC